MYEWSASRTDLTPRPSADRGAVASVALSGVVPLAGTMRAGIRSVRGPASRPVVTGICCAHPIRRFRSAWMGIAIRAVNRCSSSRCYSPLVSPIVLSWCCPGDPRPTPAREVTVRIDDLARPIARLRRLPAPTADAGLAVIFVAAVGVERVLDPLHGGPTVLTSAVLTLVLAGSLALRRRLPLTAFVMGTAALCAESLLHVASVVSPIANQILAYSLGLYATRTRARWGPPIILAGVLVYFADTIRTEAFQPISTLFVWVATWAVGYSTARRREEQDRARRAIRRQVVAEERTRMARELHDVVAHHVSVIGVLAAAAKRQMDRDPGKASAALASIEDSSRQAVVEMHRLLGFLRQEDRKSTRLNSSHLTQSRMPSSA